MRSDLKTLTLAMSNDEDDDFQNPSEAVAIAQNLILSSLKDRNSSRTPKPSNGAPPRKRQKALVASGKENRRVSQAQTSRNVRVSRVREEKKAERDERRSLSSSIGAGPVEVCQVREKSGVLGQPCNWNTNGSNLLKNRKLGEVYDDKSRVSYVYKGRKAVEEEMSGLSDSDGGISTANEGDGLKGEKSRNLTPNGSNSVEYSNNGEVSFEISTVPCTIDESEAVREERKNLLATIGSGSLELPLVSASSHHTSYDYAETHSSDIACTLADELEEENSCLLTAVESQVVENSQIKEFVSEYSTRCKNTESRKEEKSCLLVSTDSKLVENGIGVSKGCKDTIGPKEEKRSYYSMSIESRLLGVRAKSGSSNVGNDCVDFDPGTQLNVLMDLCCQAGSSSSRVLSPEENYMGFESSELLMDEIVECPLCGTDITGLSEELRQVHTNDCLDKDGTPEVATTVGEIKSDQPKKLVDVSPVLEWLQALGLSKYGEAFTREEVDWETLQWLTEEDLISIGVVTLGPRKKIIHALNDIRQNSLHGQEAENDISNMTTMENTKLLTPGNKLITEFFQAPVGHRSASSLSKPLRGFERTTKDSTRRRVGPRSHFSRGKVRDIPPWCCIPGTPFRVDAFRFLRGDCSHWFLTHFHMDHYQGLTRSFCHGKIYCSSITAHLVNTKIGVSWERLHILPLNQIITIAGVNLTCLDANHCPGSIIILFEPPNGKAVLHTGDFRFSAEMASSSVLQTCHVDTLILDTTYCNPQYDFPKQEAVIQFVIEAIQAEAFNPKTLFLIGSYTIGKERLFLEVARLLRRKVYVGAAKLRLLRCLGLPEEDMQWFTINEMESQIHVVPMWTIASFKRMKHISNQYSDRFNLIVAFSPTGWTYGKGKKKTPGRRWQQGTMIRYEVPYSEHCSFTELREFVQFISPQHIIPSVNNDSPESADAMISLLMSVA